MDKYKFVGFQYESSFGFQSFNMVSLVGFVDDSCNMPLTMTYRFIVRYN